MHPAISHRPDPDHPGWWTWDIESDEDRFNQVIGRLHVRGDGPGRALCRMRTAPAHANIGGAFHGGALLTFVDMALFAGGHNCGVDVHDAVTLDCNVQFIDAVTIGTFIVAEVELLRQTKRLAFLRGRVLQDERVVAAYSGSLRKATRGS